MHKILIGKIYQWSGLEILRLEPQNDMRGVGIYA